VANAAQVLMEQGEVTEFVAKGIDHTWLWSTVTLACYLLQHANCALFQEGDGQIQPFSRDRGSLFLDIWEYFVYPVLKVSEHNEWAEKWRGGHITNYV
jgi:hypothetical protein